MTSKYPVTRNSFPATPGSDRKVTVATAPVTSLEETVVVDHHVSHPADEKDDKVLAVKQRELQKACALAKSLKGSSVLRMPGVKFVSLRNGSTKGGMPDLAISCVLATGFGISVNTAAGKYLQFLNGSTSFKISNVGSSSEFSSFGSIFDEFFIHSVDFKYKPVNRYSANSTGNAVLATAAGAPGFVNTCGASVTCLQHNQPAYSDASSDWIASSVAAGARYVDMGTPWIVTWKNNEKFSWDGPQGDQTTVTNTQAWCNLANSAEYGGLIQLATPLASGAAAGIGDLTEGGVFGHVLAHYHVSFRARS